MTPVATCSCRPVRPWLTLVVLCLLEPVRVWHAAAMQSCQLDNPCLRHLVAILSSSAAVALLARVAMSRFYL
jgi:hypothetical protein